MSETFKYGWIEHYHFWVELGMPPLRHKLLTGYNQKTFSVKSSCCRSDSDIRGVVASINRFCR